MPTLTAIRDRLVDRLDTIPGLTVVTADAASVPPPYAVVIPPADGVYHATMSDTGFYGPLDWRIRVMVGAQLLDDAADAVLRFLEPAGESSVRAAIHADQSLDGLLDTAHSGAAVMGWRFLSYEEAAEAGRWGVEFTVTVVAKKG